MEIIIFRAPPAAGKTTKIRSLMGPRDVRMNNDDLAASLFTGGRLKAHGRVLHELRLAMLRSLMAQDLDRVFVDNTNLNIHTVNALSNCAYQAGNTVTVDDSLLQVPLEVCLYQNEQRPREARVPDDVVRRMHADAQALMPWKPRDYPPERMYVPDESLPLAVMFDIDGTMAEKHPDRGIYDISKVHMDLPRENVVSLAERFLFDDMSSPHLEVQPIFLSGRDESCREATEKWLAYHTDATPILFMRPAGDVRPDFVVKHALFHEHVAPNYNVLYCLDDRDQVVNMWRRIGVECWQVAAGAF